MSLKYKTVTTTTLKVSGIIDADRGVIDVDGVEKNLMALLSDFNGGYVELSVKVKDESENDDPTIDSDEDDE